ncbi:MAG: hypothetical protein ABW360_17460 [Phenylobacterium sp.]
MHDQDLKKLLTGAAAAAIMGLMLGGTMQPDLDISDRPEGPQMFATGGGARSTGPFDDGASFAGYQGQVPDYVVGTDWKKQVAWNDAPIAAEPAPREYAASEPARVTYTPAVYAEPQREPASYPSVAGGSDYTAVKAAAPAAAVGAKPVFDEDVPPEATGDTTISASISSN